MSKAIDTVPYLTTFEFRVAGIPCIIGVKEYFKQEPQGSWADSDWDCYGYTDVDYDILDRKGYLANWLAKKSSDSDDNKIFDAIEKQMQ